MTKRRRQNENLRQAEVKSAENIRRPHSNLYGMSKDDNEADIRKETSLVLWFKRGHHGNL